MNSINDCPKDFLMEMYDIKDFVKRINGVKDSLKEIHNDHSSGFLSKLI